MTRAAATRVGGAEASTSGRASARGPGSTILVMEHSELISEAAQRAGISRDQAELVVETVKEASSEQDLTKSVLEQLAEAGPASHRTGVFASPVRLFRHG